jgi:hypothetical protein
LARFDFYKGEKKMARISISLPIAMSIFNDLKEGNNKQFLFESIGKMRNQIVQKRFRLVSLLKVAEKHNLLTDFELALNKLEKEEEFLGHFLTHNKQYEKQYHLSANQLISELERLKKDSKQPA